MSMGQLSKPAFGVVPTFIANLASGSTSQIWGAEVMRDYVYVADAADAFVRAALDVDPPPRVLNVGTGVGHTPVQIHEALARLMDRSEAPVMIADKPRTDPAGTCSTSAVRWRRWGRISACR